MFNVVKTLQSWATVVAVWLTLWDYAPEGARAWVLEVLLALL